MNRFDRITINPAIVNGQACIRGMRLTVKRVVEAVALSPDRDELFRGGEKPSDDTGNYVALSPDRDELFREYPELDAEDVRQALDFAACNLDDSVIKLEAA